MTIFFNNIKLAIIGLDFVGLPLAVEFAKKRPVVGIDINQNRVNELRDGRDLTLEVSDAEFEVHGLFFRYEKHFVYWQHCSNGDIGIVIILQEPIHQTWRFKVDFEGSQ